MSNVKEFTWKPTGTRKVIRPVENPKKGEDKFEEIDEEWPFTGEIVVKMTKATERLKLSKECRIEVKDGEVQSKDTTETAIKLIEIAKEKIKKVNLRRKDDGFVFNNVEDLEYDTEGAEILSTIGGKVLEGVKIGKN